MSGFLDETAALCRKYGLPDTQLVRGAGELRGYHVRAAVLGGFNTGKSALVNALAGAYLSRVSLCGETRVPAEIFYGTQGVQVVRNGAAVRSDPSVLRQGGALDGAQLVRAALPLPALRELAGVSLLDTPALEAARARENPVLSQLVRTADAYLLVVGADAPVVTGSVTAVLSGLSLAQKPVLAVLTKCDQFSPADARAIAAKLQSDLRAQLGLPDLIVCRVSCTGAPDVDAVREFLRALQKKSAGMQRREGARLLSLGAQPLAGYLRQRIESARQLEPELAGKAGALGRQLERLHSAVDALNERMRTRALDALAQSAKARRTTLTPLAAPLAYLLRTQQNAAVYADGALRSVLRAEARSRLAPVLNAYETNLRRLSNLYVPDAPFHPGPDAEACADAAFPGTAETLARCEAEENSILDALETLAASCLERAALAALDEERERLAAPLYEHLASLRKALADAQSEQKDASESHRRTLEELKRDLARVAEMTQAAHKEVQDHGV